MGIFSKNTLQKIFERTASKSTNSQPLYKKEPLKSSLQENLQQIVKTLGNSNDIVTKEIRREKRRRKSGGYIYRRTGGHEKYFGGPYA